MQQATSGTSAATYKLIESHLWSRSKLIELGWALQKKYTKGGYTKGALMSSQLRHHFQASQAVHGADDITILHF